MCLMWLDWCGGQFSPIKQAERITSMCCLKYFILPKIKKNGLWKDNIHFLLMKLKNYLVFSFLVIKKDWI